MAPRPVNEDGRRYVVRAPHHGDEPWSVVDSADSRIICTGAEKTAKAFAAHLNVAWNAEQKHKGLRGGLAV